MLDDIPDRAYCRLDRLEPRGYTGLLIGTIEHVELADLTDPLVHFRGEYRSLQ